MTKKDYLAIGAALRSFRLMPPSFIAEYIADVFEKDNPLFDRERFIRFVETGKDTKS